jgi:hypothetical protein
MIDVFLAASSRRPLIVCRPRFIEFLRRKELGQQIRAEARAATSESRELRPRAGSSSRRRAVAFFSLSK